jgi:hypothetical protein
MKYPRGVRSAHTYLVSLCLIIVRGTMSTSTDTGSFMSVDSLQDLIDSGFAWKMEGSVGREAMNAIKNGECVLGPEGCYDYWGNYVPSRHEVVPGTVGSLEYAEKLQKEL